MTDTDIDARLRLAETRANRLQAVADGYEVYDEGMPDPTVPGTAKVVTSHDGKLIRKHPRYVLVTQHGDHGNYRLYLGEDVANVEQLAAQAATDSEGGELVYCYYDLDELVGDPPRPSEGDKVRLTEEGKAYGTAGEPTDGEFYVVWSETDTFDGEAYEKLCLHRKQDVDAFGGDYMHKIDEQYVEIVELAYPDKRMPRRYGVAKVITHVVFNTIPTEA